MSISWHQVKEHHIKGGEMRKLCKLIPLLVILTLVWGVNLSYGDIVAGVEGGSLPEATLEEAPAGEILEASVQATVIDFDDSAEPCGFSETTALRNKYSAQGVVFSGPAALDGGAILNECSFFAVTGHSPPNFLAFNINGFMFDGGIPRGPETLVFDPPVSYVQVNAGDGVDPE